MNKINILIIFVGLIMYSKMVFANDLEIKFMKNNNEIFFDEGGKPIIEDGVNLVTEKKIIESKHFVELDDTPYTIEEIEDDIYFGTDHYKDITKLEIIGG